MTATQGFIGRMQYLSIDLEQHNLSRISWPVSDITLHLAYLVRLGMLSTSIFLILAGLTSSHQGPHTYLAP